MLLQSCQRGSNNLFYEEPPILPIPFFQILSKPPFLSPLHMPSLGNLVPEGP